jgi:protein gp37
LGGRCPHECTYCFVDNPLHGRPLRYTGDIRLLEEELRVPYGEGKTILVDHMNDLFADLVRSPLIQKVLDHCRSWPANTYVFQTKNPQRYFEFLAGMPPKKMLGTTIETNRDLGRVSRAPDPMKRLTAIMALAAAHKTFITLEPILDFDLGTLTAWIKDTRPAFINIGADSKGHGLKEPSAEKIQAFILEIQASGIEIRQKRNLNRLLKDS